MGSRKLTFYLKSDFISASRYYNSTKMSKNLNKKPYKIIQTPNAGRTLVATRDIKAQEIILTDEAPIVAPILYSGQVNFKISFFCIVCFKLCRGSLKCPRCKLPICDKNCAKLKTHI